MRSTPLAKVAQGRRGQRQCARKPIAERTEAERQAKRSRHATSTETVADSRCDRMKSQKGERNLGRRRGETKSGARARPVRRTRRHPHYGTTHIGWGQDDECKSGEGGGADMADSRSPAAHKLNECTAQRADESGIRVNGRSWIDERRSTAKTT